MKKQVYWYFSAFTGKNINNGIIQDHKPQNRKRKPQAFPAGTRDPAPDRRQHRGAVPTGADTFRIYIASDFQLEYVSIHPFFDGNGRTGRIFSNQLLISCGYPPAIIMVEEKEKYFKTLADIQVYGANSELFCQLLGKSMLRSLEMQLDAFDGSIPKDLCT